MKERPILFSGPMVRALLDGRKTQTRRVAKTFKSYVPALGKEDDCLMDWDGLPSRVSYMKDGTDLCPYGVPGDRLWVKETWKPDPAWGVLRDVKPTAIPEGTNLLFRATLPEDHPKAELHPWRPAIFMRRWMSRITLELVAVRVERLRDISAEDALSEGIDHYCPNVTAALRGEAEADPIDEYRQLWERINGAGSWAANPWVWVIEFRRVTA
jgi:hypothetical protein